MKLGINIRTSSSYCGNWDKMASRLTELRPSYVRTVCPRTSPHGDFTLFSRIHQSFAPTFVLTAKLQPTDGITHSIADLEAVILECSSRGLKIMLEAPNEWDKSLTAPPANALEGRCSYAPLESFTRSLLNLGMRTNTPIILPSMIRDFAPQTGFAWLADKSGIANLHYYGHAGYEAWYNNQQYRIEAAPVSRRFVTEFGFDRRELPMTNPNDVFKWQLARFQAFDAAILFELADNTQQGTFGLLDSTGATRNDNYWKETVNLFKASL